MFKSNTPDNIDSLSIDEVLQYVDDTDLNVVSKTKRLNLIKVIYKLLGYELSPDLALALVSEHHAQLILATAGSGKTTSVSIKMIVEKIFRKSPVTGKLITGDKMLCLVYNKHNVKPMEIKHKQLVAKLYASGLGGLTIDSNLKACTMHSFCETWKNEYVGKCGLINHKLMSDTEVSTLMNTCIKAVRAKHNLSANANISVSNLLGLYNYMRESMLDISKISTVDKFVDLGLPESVVVDIFKLYDKMKTTKRLYDFTDMLYKVLQMLKQHADIRERIQNYYDYITADEIQDFTPIMMEILKLIVGPAVPLVCIGDEDQSIYNFRGADIFNALDFNSRFEDGKIYTLHRNRRCKQNIIDAAVTVVSENTMRFDKKILGTKADGLVEYVPYLSREGQFINLLKRVSSMSTKELENTVICYRDRESSLFITEMLEAENIPFNVISGYMPFSHELYNHVVQILDILYMPYDRELHLNLYKVLPITREDLYKVLGYDAKGKKFSDTNNTYVHFASENYGEFTTRKSFTEALGILAHISSLISEQPLNVYFPIVFDLIRKYFWNYKSSLNDNSAVDSYFTDKVFKFFNVSLKYKDLYNEYTKRSNACERLSESKVGITLSTMHSLKGLEFSKVFIIDLEESRFPNFSLIESKSYTEDTKKTLKECETRLMYVAMTRAIDELYMYYSDENPSYYIKRLIKRGDSRVAPSVGSNLIDIEAEILDEPKENEYDEIVLELDIESCDSVEYEEVSLDLEIEEAVPNIEEIDTSKITTATKFNGNHGIFNNNNTLLNSILTKI